MIAVTGSGGFIGRAVVAELVARGEAVRHLDLPAHDVRFLQPGDLDACDGIIHLAGVLGTHELFDTPDLAVDVNVKGTLSVLQAARANDARYVGITMPAVFPSIYTATKMACVGLERAFHHEGLHVSRVRAFNAFGPGQAHGPGHPQKIVPTFAVEAWAGRPIPIWGDGTQTVDLIHTGDLARLLADALDFGDDATIDGGTALSLSVLDVANMVLDITGSKAGVRFQPMRRGEVPTKIVATGDGWDRLDWRPRFRYADLLDTVLSYESHPLVVAA